MFIYLLDSEKQEEQQVDLTVEYTTPGQDLFAAFYTKPAKYPSSQPPQPVVFQDYLIKKVSHIMGAKMSYGGCQYSLTLGFYADERSFVPFVIDQAVLQEQEDNHARTCFGTAQEAYGHNQDSHCLFNYQEYVQLTALGLAPLSFSEFVTQLLKERGFSIEQHTLYHMGPAHRFSLQNVVDHKGWSALMEQAIAQ